MSGENTNWSQSVTGVVIKDNKILLARHTYGSGNGKLIIPGGYVDFGETPQRVFTHLRGCLHTSVFIEWRFLRQKDRCKMNLQSLFCSIQTKVTAILRFKPVDFVETAQKRGK